MSIITHFSLKTKFNQPGDLANRKRRLPGLWHNGVYTSFFLDRWSISIFLYVYVRHRYQFKETQHNNRVNSRLCRGSLHPAFVFHMPRRNYSPPTNDVSVPKELECPVCLDRFQNACFANCGHIFCSECILKCWHIREREGQNGRRKKPVPCPLDNLPIHFFIPAYQLNTEKKTGNRHDNTSHDKTAQKLQKIWNEQLHHYNTLFSPTLVSSSSSSSSSESTSESELGRMSLQRRSMSEYRW